MVFAANLCFEPTVATLIRRELGTRAAAAHGDIVTPVLARAETQEWEWARTWTTALARFVLADAEHGESNRAVLRGWVRDWLPEALAAAAALVPVAEAIGSTPRGRASGCRPTPVRCWPMPGCPSWANWWGMRLWLRTRRGVRAARGPGLERQARPARVGPPSIPWPTAAMTSWAS